MLKLYCQSRAQNSVIRWEVEGREYHTLNKLLLASVVLADTEGLEVAGVKKNEIFWIHISFRNQFVLFRRLFECVRRIGNERQKTSRNKK